MKKFFCGVLVGAIIMTTGAAFAEGITKTIEAKFGQVKLVVNGKNIEKETLLYDGRTYLPLRDTADALGMDVTWDEKTGVAGLYNKGTAPKVEEPKTETTKEAEKPKETPTTTTTQTSSNATMGQKNALATAKDYLKYTSFSYKGLLEQLKYEKYTDEEAAYGVDNCGADWNEQAVKTASDYLKVSSFSRADLISQLEYEGFTNAQAVYGVEKNGY